GGWVSEAADGLQRRLRIGLSLWQCVASYNAIEIRHQAKMLEQFASKVALFARHQRDPFVIESRECFAHIWVEPGLNQHLLGIMFSQKVEPFPMQFRARFLMFGVRRLEAAPDQNPDPVADERRDL